MSLRAITPSGRREECHTPSDKQFSDGTSSRSSSQVVFIGSDQSSMDSLDMPDSAPLEKSNSSSPRPYRLVDQFPSPPASPVDSLEDSSNDSPQLRNLSTPSPLRPIRKSISPQKNSKGTFETYAKWITVALGIVLVSAVIIFAIGIIFATTEWFISSTSITSLVKGALATTAGRVALAGAMGVSFLLGVGFLFYGLKKQVNIVKKGY